MRTEPRTVPDLAVDLAEFATDLRVERLTAVGAAKMNIGDTLSCALAGSSAPGVAAVSSLVREWGGAPQANVFDRLGTAFTSGTRASLQDGEKDPAQTEVI
jgi:2-methylcitrate dehydratase PrpD